MKPKEILEKLFQPSRKQDQTIQTVKESFLTNYQFCLGKTFHYRHVMVEAGGLLFCWEIPHEDKNPSEKTEA